VPRQGRSAVFLQEVPADRDFLVRRFVTRGEARRDPVRPEQARAAEVKRLHVGPGIVLPPADDQEPFLGIRDVARAHDYLSVIRGPADAYH